MKESGWTAAVSQAGITSPGTVESFLRASNLTKTRLAHQITARRLYKLCKVGYSKYVTEAKIGDEDVLSFMDWCSKRKVESPQFHFWSMILNFELAILLFIRSHREANFALYKDILFELIPYFFALDHVNYARWLPVHLSDMANFYPELNVEFEKGNFAVHSHQDYFFHRN